LNLGEAIQSRGRQQEPQQAAHPVKPQ
jgi:hypothetical protein